MNNHHESFSKSSFYLDGWIVHPTECVVESRHDRDLQSKLTPKAMEVLIVLASVNTEVVLTDNLLEQVWGNSISGPNAVQKCIAEIRKALDDDARNPKLLITVPKRGYKLKLTPSFVGSTTKRKYRYPLAAGFTVLAVSLFLGFSYIDEPEDAALAASGTSDLVDPQADDNSNCASEEAESECPKVTLSTVAVLPFGDPTSSSPKDAFWRSAYNIADTRAWSG